MFFFFFPPKLKFIQVPLVSFLKNSYLCATVCIREGKKRESGGGAGHVCGCLQRPSVSLRCSGVTCACEQPDVGSENQTQVLWRIAGALLQWSIPPAPSPSVFTSTASRLFFLSTYLMLNCGPLWFSAVCPPKLYIVWYGAAPDFFSVALRYTRVRIC